MKLSEYAKIRGVSRQAVGQVVKRYLPQEPPEKQQLYLNEDKSLSEAGVRWLDDVYNKKIRQAKLTTVAEKIDRAEREASETKAAQEATQKLLETM